MFDRLKSLPLTILLTMLIWMYAESQVNSTRAEAKVTLKDVPVWISGSPETLAQFAQYDVTLDPKTMEVTVVGTPDRIKALKGSEIQAYVVLTSEEKPIAGTVSSRELRVVPPEGITISQAPGHVKFRVVESGSTKPDTKPEK